MFEVEDDIAEYLLGRYSNKETKHSTLPEYSKCIHYNIYIVKHCISFHIRLSICISSIK
jgi:hypothetical protein